MKRTEILLLRHGESLGNSMKIMTGQTDIALSDRGRLQAAAAAEFISELGIEVIYSSDLSRAYETACAVAHLCGLPVIKSSELREVYYGDFEGASMLDLREREGEAFSRYWTSDFGVYHFPGGENTAEAGERFYRECERIAKANEGRRILVAAHAGVIRSFWGIVMGIPRAQLGAKIPFPTNASLSRVEYKDGKFTPISYSENDYIKEVGFIDYKQSRV